MIENDFHLYSLQRGDACSADNRAAGSACQMLYCIIYFGYSLPDTQSLPFAGALEAPGLGWELC
jgi:hypothetical protein